jgi:putative ABC transport system substrate-binding protein
VTDGLVTSLARPGGNVTGLAGVASDLVGKRLELLTQAVPGVSRVAVLWHPGGQAERTAKDMLKGTDVAARALGVRLQSVEVRGPVDFDRAFSDMTEARAGALTVVGSVMFFIERRRLVDLAAKSRLPAVPTMREFVDAGGLMAYGPNQADLTSDDVYSGEAMNNNGPRCPGCGSADVAIRGSAAVQNDPSPSQVWECKTCGFVFAYRPGRRS